MKKFFAILLTVLTTLVLLPACGGGGDDGEDSLIMTPKDYKMARKHFIIGAGTNGTLYYVPANGGTVVSDTRDENDANGSVLISGELGGIAQVAVEDNPGRAYTVSVNNYECFYNGEGKIEKAILSFSYDGVTNDDEATQAFWNIAVAEGEVAGALQIKMELDFITMTWKMIDRDDAEDDGGEQDPQGGLFTVKKGTNPSLDYRF